MSNDFNDHVKPRIARVVEVEVAERSPAKIELDPNKPTIYICGGFYGDFNEQIKNAVKDLANVLDPRDWSGDKCECTYVSRDIDAIESAEIIMAYKQASNPGIGMAHEIGYAAGAADKYIIYTGEYKDTTEHRYWSFARQLCDHEAPNLDAAIHKLCSIIRDWYEERAA